MQRFLERISLSHAMALAVGIALVAVEIPAVSYNIAAELDEIEVMAGRRADAALDMLEAVHIQSMINRGQTDDGDPAIETLNGSMEQFSDVSRGVDLWLVMGPKVLAYQLANNQAEVEGPLDDVDAAAVSSAQPQRTMTTEGVLRVTRPIVMGQGHAQHERCASCHTKMMDVGAGEVIGAYSAAVDLQPELTTWQSGLVRQVATSMGVAALTLCLIFSMLHVVALRPLQRLARVTRQLAHGEIEVEDFGSGRVDELGMMAQSLDVFRTNLIAKQELEAENALAVQALRKSEARFRDIAGAASDWVWETDRHHRFTYLSDRFVEVTGYKIKDTLGRKQCEILTPNGEGSERESHQAHFATNQAFRGLRYTLTTANGSVHVCELSGQPILDADGHFAGYRGTANDITVQLEAQSRASYLALHDPLTDLPNRVLFAERLEHAVAVVQRHGGSAAVLCLDLDHFKEVNDTLGHDTGDLLLKDVALRLQGSLRETDTIARLGGDEFAIIQVGGDQPESAETLCRRLLSLFDRPARIGDHDTFVGLSIGVALVPNDGGDPLQLLKNADIALYRAKADGRSTFRFFAPEMDAELQVRKALERDLRKALSQSELELYYQPLIDAMGDHIVGVEALIRWHHPTRGMVSPAEFIPIAETTGLILPIGEWVLRTACAQAMQWPDISMSINLSPVQFRHPDLVGLVKDVLEDTGLPPEQLELEITEGVLLQDTQAALGTVENLKKLGIRIAMDDFGTGYSSLSHLRRFPFDKLKVDQSFVHVLEKDPNAAAIIRSVLGLGRSLGMVTTAEGVETEHQLGFLRAEGCNQVQGYHLGRPQPAARLSQQFEKDDLAKSKRIPLERLGT